MKATDLRAQITVTGYLKSFAVILSILEPLGIVGTQRILRMIAARYGWTLEFRNQ